MRQRGRHQDLEDERAKRCLDDQDPSIVVFVQPTSLPEGMFLVVWAIVFTLATFTALQKKDGGVRGIATSTTFRRLVAKTFAKQLSKQVEVACAPFQFALSTRAGVDCVRHTVRVMTEGNPDATLLSINGVGAYDHVLRTLSGPKKKASPRGIVACESQQSVEAAAALRRDCSLTMICPDGPVAGSVQ